MLLLVFFVISGFLITQSFIRTENIAIYFKKRAIRILPAYILVVTLSFLLLSFRSEYSFVEYFTNIESIKYLGYNLIFLNFLQPCLPGVFTSNPIHCAVNGSLWTIKIEVAFYIVVPIIIGWLESRKKNRKIALLIALYSLSYLLYIAESYTNNKILILLSRQLPGFLVFFTSGILLFYLKDFLEKRINILFVLSIVIFFFRHYPIFSFLFPFSFAIIIYYCAFRLKFLNNFVFWGDISYGVYIYHFPTIQLIISLKILQQYNLPTVLTSVIVIVITLALFSWHFFEKPLLSLVRKK